MFSGGTKNTHQKPTSKRKARTRRLRRNTRVVNRNVRRPVVRGRPLFPWLQPATSLSAAPLHQNCCSKYFLVDTDAAISTTNLGRPYSFKLFDEQGRQPERAPFHWLACTKLYKWRCSHLLRNACVKKTWGKFFFHPRKFSGKTENTSTKSKRCSPSVSFLTLRSSLL